MAAVGGFFIGKAIEKGIENSPEAQKNIGAVVQETGLRGVSALSSASLERNRSEANDAAQRGDPQAFSEGSNLLTAAATLLSIGTVKKLLNKAGDIIPGTGINPGGGAPDVNAPPPNLDRPDGPASSAINAERLRQELTVRQLAEANGARSTIGDIRANLTLANPNRPGNTAVADIQIEGIADTRLAAHSQIDTQQAGLVGNGSGNFSFTTEASGNGFGIARNTDAEYKILDTIADRLRNNPNASGSINLFTELPPCPSCSNVITQFRARFPNITVNVTTVGRQPATVVPVPRR